MGETMQGLMMDYQLTLDRILEHAVRLHANKRILTKMPAGAVHEYTYGDFYRRVKRLCNILESLHVEPGDRVGTFAWNNYQHLELYYGIPCAGAICHTLNIRLGPDQLAFTIRHAEDKVIFLDGTLLPLLERITESLSDVRHIVLFNAERGITTRLPNVLFYEELMTQAKEEYAWKSLDENAAAGLCYTSGTTGDPKGALYSHRSMFLHTLGVNLSSSISITESDVVLPVVPQFHAMAWGLPYACIMSGADVLMPGPHLQPAALAQLIEEHRVTVAAGVPTIWGGLYYELKAHPRDLSSVRSLIVGGAAMPRSLIEGFEKDLGVNVCHAWGMTETSPLGTACRLGKAHQNLPDHEKWDIKAKQGRPSPLVELRIVNEEGKELPWDGTTMGELQIRGPWVIRQYYKMERSEDQFTQDGWFRTGDVATISHDGFMNITDRTKDLIKSGGEWISSVALENAIMAHPKILEAAVISIPDEKWTERPMAVVVAAPQAGVVSAEEIIDHLAKQFPRYWLPEKIAVVQSLPKTTVGKFDKKMLRHMYSTGKLG